MKRKNLLSVISAVTVISVISSCGTAERNDTPSVTEENATTSASVTSIDELDIETDWESMAEIEEIDIKKSGKDIMIGFNPKFLIDALKVIDDEEIDVYMVNPKAPCFIRDEDGKYIYLILPVNFTTVS